MKNESIQSENNRAPSRAGFQAFVCEECHFEWIMDTRDALSLSTEPCPNCGDRTQPVISDVRGWPLLNGSGPDGRDYIVSLDVRDRTRVKERNQRIDRLRKEKL